MRVKTGITQKEENIRMIAIELSRTFICFFLLFRANVSMSSRPHHHESRSRHSAQIPGIYLIDERTRLYIGGSQDPRDWSLRYVSGTYRLYIGRASLPGSLLLCCPSSLRKNLKNSNDFQTNHIFLVNDKATHVLTMINKTYVTKLLATADCAMTSLTVLINRGGWRDREVGGHSISASPTSRFIKFWKTIFFAIKIIYLSF